MLGILRSFKIVASSFPCVHDRSILSGRSGMSVYKTFYNKCLHADTTWGLLMTVLLSERLLCVNSFFLLEGSNGKNPLFVLTAS